MKITVVTGASSGMGKEFVSQIQRGRTNLEEIWVIARREEKLRELPKTPIPLRIFALDLTGEEGQTVYKEALAKERPQICMLVHCAGMGLIGRMDELSVREQMDEIALNCTSLTAVTLYALPYLHKGSRVIELVSASAFAPQPGFGIYAATKAYALSFARTLRAELKTRGITVTAVCPGPVDTPFFEIAERGKKRPAFKTLFLADPRKVVRKALEDSRAGRALSIYGFWMKLWYFSAKLIPHGVIAAVLTGSEREGKSTRKDEERCSRNHRVSDTYKKEKSVT